MKALSSWIAEEITLVIGVIAFLFMGSLNVSASVTKNIDALKLIDSVMYRYDGETQVFHQTLSTCAYSIGKSGVKCESTPRKKKLQAIVKKYGDQLRDSKDFTLIVSPVSDRGISILQYDYFEAGKDTDQWLYLPEIDSVKRVASSEDAPKNGSLFGSEFSLEDLEKPKLERFEWTVVDLNDKKPNIVVIDQKPTQHHAKSSNYSKRRYWIDQKRLIIIKTEYYAWDGSLHKVSYNYDVEKIEKIWTVKKTVMRNVQSKRISVLTIDDVKYNQKIDDGFFEVRILSDAVFQASLVKSLAGDSVSSVESN